MKNETTVSLMLCAVAITIGAASAAIGDYISSAVSGILLAGMLIMWFGHYMSKKIMTFGVASLAAMKTHALGLLLVIAVAAGLIVIVVAIGREILSRILSMEAEKQRRKNDNIAAVTAATGNIGIGAMAAPAMAAAPMGPPAPVTVHPGLTLLPPVPVTSSDTGVPKIEYTTNLIDWIEWDGQPKAGAFGAWRFAK